MLRLLKVQLGTRLFSLWFAVSAVFCVIMGIILGLGHDKPVTADHGFQLEDFPYIIAIMLCGALAAVFIGSEFSEGTVRSKLTVGYKRGHFYLSQLILTAVIAVLLFACITLPYFLLAYKYFFSLYSAGYLIKGFGLILLSMVGSSVLFTLVCMTVRMRTVSIIVCAALALGFDYASSQLRRRLMFPEMTEKSVVEFSEEGAKTNEEKSFEKNALYKEEPVRSFYKTAYYLMPVSAAKDAGSILNTWIMAFGEDDEQKITDYYEANKMTWDKDFALETQLETWRYPAWLLPEMLVFTAAGLLIFRKRNIN